MADEEKFLEDDVTVEPEEEGGEKAGFLPSLLINIFKWIAIGIAVIILVATVSWATFQLFLKGRTSSDVPEYSSKQTAADLKLEFYSSDLLKQIRGTTVDIPPKSFMAIVSLGYDKGKTAVQTEIIEKNEIIHNQIVKFFGSKEASQLTTKNWGILEEEIESLINNGIMRSGLIRKVLIHELTPY